MRDRTKLITGGRKHDGELAGFVNPPLTRGSTVLHKNVADMRVRVARRNAGDDDPPYAYGIYGSPTHDAFYDALTALEGGYRSWALPSGLSACSIAILAFVQHGDHVLFPDSVYWPTRRFCLQTLPRFGVAATAYDPRIGGGIERLFTPTTRVLFVETPGSHTFEMQDLPLLAGVARARGAMTVADNTWATPLYFKPLAAGADVSLHAVTKYIGGHSDLLLGTVTANERAWPALRTCIHHFGLTTSPDDCWLALRGLRSLWARLIHHRAQPEVERVLYPALADDPGYALWRRDMTGATGLFGVVLRENVSEAALHALIDSLQRFGRGYSWGGFESLLIPSSPERTVTPLPFKGRLIRVHAGLEDPVDLIEDLERGFARLRATG